MTRRTREMRERERERSARVNTSRVCRRVYHEVDVATAPWHHELADNADGVRVWCVGSYSPDCWGCGDADCCSGEYEKSVERVHNPDRWDALMAELAPQIEERRRIWAAEAAARAAAEAAAQAAAEETRRVTWEMFDAEFSEKAAEAHTAAAELCRMIAEAEEKLPRLLGVVQTTTDGATAEAACDEVNRIYAAYNNAYWNLRDAYESAAFVANRTTWDECQHQLAPVLAVWKESDRKGLLPQVNRVCAAYAERRWELRFRRVWNAVTGIFAGAAAAARAS